MRRKVVLLSSAFAACILASTSARAEDTVAAPAEGGMIEVGVSQGHLDRNYGIDIAPEKAIEGTVISYTHDHFTGILRSFTLISSADYGHRGMGDEQQLQFAYHAADQTRLGRFEYQAAISYRLLDMGKGLGDISDDYIEFTGQLAYPIRLGGSWKITPYARVVKDIPVGHNNPLTWEGGGVRLYIPIMSDARLYVDGLFLHDVNSETAVPHKNVWDIEVGVSRKLWFGVVGTMGATYPQYSERDTRFEYRPRFDGRLDPYPRLDKDRTRPGPKLFVTLAHRF
jgi:hypothetical protein